MIFRSSMISTFKACPAKACYKYELGLVPYGVKRKKNDLEFGSLVHDSIERYHLAGDDLKAALDFLNKQEIQETRRKNKTTAAALVKDYAAKNQIKMIEVEKLFTYDLGGGHTWMGRFDGIGEWNGDLWVIEHKTTNPEYLMNKPNDQFIAYYIGANILYGDVKGVYLNNLNCDKLEVKSWQITFNQDETEEWKDEMAATAEAYATYKRLGIFPRNQGACRMYNSRCCYMPLCTEPEGTRALVQERCYVVNEEARKLQW